MVGPFRPGLGARVVFCLIGAALLATSCDFSSVDDFEVFPPYLQRAVATVDLEDLLEEEGFGSGMQITRIEQVTSPTDGASFVLVFLEEETRKRLLVLNAADLSVSRIEENSSFNGFLGVDTQGRFLCGPTAFAASAALSSVDINLATALNSYPDPARIESLGGSGFNALLGMSGSLIRLLHFTTAQAWTPFTDYSTQMSDASEYTFLDAVRGDDTSDAVHILLSRDDRIVVASFDNFNALRSTMAVAQAAAATFTSRASLIAGAFFDGSHAWITRDGVVVADGNDRQLIYYPFSDLMHEEPLKIGQDYEDCYISVDDEGDRWFLFNHETSMMYALRTWW